MKRIFTFILLLEYDCIEFIQYEAAESATSNKDGLFLFDEGLEVKVINSRANIQVFLRICHQYNFYFEVHSNWECPFEIPEG